LVEKLSRVRFLPHPAQAFLAPRTRTSPSRSTKSPSQRTRMSSFITRWTMAVPANTRLPASLEAQSSKIASAAVRRRSRSSYLLDPEADARSEFIASDLIALHLPAALPRPSPAPHQRVRSHIQLHPHLCQLCLLPALHLQVLVCLLPALHPQVLVCLHRLRALQLAAAQRARSLTQDHPPLTWFPRLT
jgi:hypothetical protein